MKLPIQTQQDILNQFRYCSLTGNLYHRVERQKVNIYKRAGSPSSSGYLQVRLQNKAYPVHQLIYWMHYGHKPGVVDHINGNKMDNRIENLRECTHTQNLWNQGKRKNGKNQYKNVYKTPSGKFAVRISVNNKLTHFGTYFTEEEAVFRRNEIIKGLRGEFGKV
jgi:hypothetical protein